MKFYPSMRRLVVAAAFGCACTWNVPTLADIPVDTAFGGLRPIELDDLAEQRGGTETLVFNENWLEGSLRDNRAVNVQSGSNLISDGAFNSAAGVVTAIQNSGSNVLLQSATIINVQVK